MKETTNRVEFPMFLYQVNIVLTDDILGSRKKRNNVLGLCSIDNQPLGLCSAADNVGECYVFFGFDGGLRTLVHESYHAVHRLHDYIGAEMEEETCAYILDYIFQSGEKLYNKEYAKRQRNLHRNRESKSGVARSGSSSKNVPWNSNITF